MDSYDNKNYEEFFDKIKKFNVKQTKQKQRGLNDYNILTTVLKPNDEARVHSRMIGSFLDVNGKHYQDDLFLNIFTKIVLNITDIGEIFEVQAEESTAENKRIDFTIKSSKYYIGIEMKVNHHDSKNQLSDYYDDLVIKAKDNGINVVQNRCAMIEHKVLF